MTGTRRPGVAARRAVAVTLLLVAGLAGAALAQGGQRGGGGGGSNGGGAGPGPRGPGSPPATTDVRPAPGADGAALLLRRMLDAERSLVVRGTTGETIDLPGVAPDPQHAVFALPVAFSPELVAKAFSLEVGESTRVSGREVQVVRLVGRSPLSPTWTFWIDGLTGVRLGYRVVDSAGRTVAEGRYTHVDGVDVRATPKPLRSPQAVIEARRLARVMSGEHVPPGFVPVGLQRTEVGADRVPALRVTLWDGIDALVLLVYRQQRALPTGASPHIASRQIGRFTVSAVGPAPRAALEAWLASLGRGPLARLDPAALEGAAAP